jgi:hypothetical protein
MQYLKQLIKPSVIMALCWWLPTSATTAAECRDSEVFKTFMDKQDYRGALQELDKCLSATKTPSTEDTKASDDLIKKLLSQTPLPAFDEVYRNFQSVLATLTAKDLKFQLANYFEGKPEEDKKIFADLRKADEKLYFYYDASRTPLDPRGFALTNKSLIWKNLTGDPEKLAFNDIQSVKLDYELGLSLTGWKLQINGKELRLSHVPENTIVPLVSALLYFVNANKDSKDKPVTLEVSDREEAILAGWVTLCSNKFQDQQDAVKNLQTLDQCFVNYTTYTKDVKTSLGKSFKLSQPDKDLLHKLTQQILVPGKSLEEGYANFKTVLSIHFFTDLQFKFKDSFAAKDQSDLFKDARDASDTLYFYFDTGTVAQGTRGLLLTDKAVVGKNLLGAAISFKNLTGSATRLPFDKTTSVTLAYERDITSPLNAWKLRFNDKKDNDLVLSKLSEDNVELFANAVVYFINTVTKPQLTLQLTNEAKDALTKSFMERYPQIKSMTDSVLGVFGTKKAEETPAKAAEQPAKTEEKKGP